MFFLESDVPFPLYTRVLNSQASAISLQWLLCRILCLRTALSSFNLVTVQSKWAAGVQQLTYSPTPVQR